MEDPTSLATLFPEGLGGKRVHVVGAGGSGVSSSLLLAREHGAEVDGCDIAETTMAECWPRRASPSSPATT